MPDGVDLGRAAARDWLDRPRPRRHLELEYAGPAIFWIVRPDGTYRLHGPGAKPRQFGKMEGRKGRWSAQSEVWADAGTYKLSDAKSSPAKAGIFPEGTGYGAIYELARSLDEFRRELAGMRYLSFSVATVLGGTDLAYDSVAISGSTASKLNMAIFLHRLGTRPASQFARRTR